MCLEHYKKLVLVYLRCFNLAGFAFDFGCGIGIGSGGIGIDIGIGIGIGFRIGFAATTRRRSCTRLEEQETGHKARHRGIWDSRIVS